MEHLYEKLAKYAREGNYPYHMPGHKRQGLEGFPEDAYRMDITEIEGFDNLHQPEGIIKELQERAAQLYGAEESFYLVGGSTCGVLAAVSCTVPVGGHILMARNCHKSAYHAAYLRSLTVSYLYPPYLEEYHIADALTPQQMEAALEKTRNVDAVLIVSPTYEGRIADVAALAEIVHKRGIPLIVDEAHGAHLGLAEGLPPNSCQAGADLVIHSVHKTLPALTQTALLHVNGALIDRERLRRFLHIYQSSSPSYLLMASIDRALHYVETFGAEAFAQFRRLYGDMMVALRGCKCLKILSGMPEIQDVGKLLISVGESRLTGRQLYDILLQEYHLQMEMVAEDFVLAMFTVSDGEEAYCRMTEALLEIDSILAGETDRKEIDSRLAEEVDRKEIDSRLAEEADRKEIDSMLAGETDRREIDSTLAREGGRKKINCKLGEESQEILEGKLASKESYGRIDHRLMGEKSPGGNDGRLAKEKDYEGDRREKRYEAVQEQEEGCIPLARAWDMAAETVTLGSSVGRQAAEFINLYPPGIPLLVPGEYMTEELYRRILKAVMQGLTVQGIIKREDQDEAGAEDWSRIIQIKVLKY